MLVGDEDVPPDRVGPFGHGELVELEPASPFEMVRNEPDSRHHHSTSIPKGRVDQKQVKTDHGSAGFGAE